LGQQELAARQALQIWPAKLAALLSGQVPPFPFLFHPLPLFHHFPCTVVEIKGDITRTEATRDMLDVIQKEEILDLEATNRSIMRITPATLDFLIGLIPSLMTMTLNSTPATKMTTIILVINLSTARKAARDGSTVITGVVSDVIKEVASDLISFNF
jgi:hypothetical protein